ncbi:expressed protein [Chlorella variabilis]|uniref:Expressed protein n=1 Tax=Chlorella variabilis TaxID=554065 RepID=E1ZA57_CHLVA|nr:expressed protein [Chlorella variabilis]EFN56998.1 expressed protein [Chlorella variabilis]|eukprot:XP_005849100.1 expressed protein [Chlorella variabilis]
MTASSAPLAAWLVPRQPWSSHSSTSQPWICPTKARKAANQRSVCQLRRQSRADRAQTVAYEARDTRSDQHMAARPAWWQLAQTAIPGACLPCRGAARSDGECTRSFEEAVMQSEGKDTIAALRRTGGWERDLLSHAAKSLLLPQLGRRKVKLHRSYIGGHNSMGHQGKTTGWVRGPQSTQLPKQRLPDDKNPQGTAGHAAHSLTEAENVRKDKAGKGGGGAEAPRAQEETRHERGPGPAGDWATKCFR